MKYQYTEKFLFEIPKTDLHVHLDGSLRIPTLIDLAKKYKVELPSYTESGLQEFVFKKQYKDLAEYLEGFKYTVAVMQTEDALERIAYEFAEDAFSENVFYFEIRFAPQLHINSQLDYERILLAVNRGLKRAKDKFNSKIEVKNGEIPFYNYGIIVCAMRMFNQYYSEYYRKLFDVHNYSTEKEIFRYASLELAKAAVEIRNKHNIPIVGFDLAGQENGYPPENHKDAYDYCHKNFMKKTVHAGEAYGPESIFQAITYLHADRIGHGFHLFHPEKIQDPGIKDRENYTKSLANYIADNRITLEVCLTSNLQTHPDVKSLKNHTFKQMIENDISVTLNTDNRLMSYTSMTNELKIATQNFEITPKKLKDIIVYGFKRSFYPDNYKTKRKYIRTIINYYDKIYNKYYNQKNKN